MIKKFIKIFKHNFSLFNLLPYFLTDLSSQNLLFSAFFSHLLPTFCYSSPTFSYNLNSPFPQTGTGICKFSNLPSPVCYLSLFGCENIEFLTANILQSLCVLSHFSCVQLFTTLRTVAPPGSLVHVILQARILEWAAMPSSRGIFLNRD